MPADVPAPPGLPPAVSAVRHPPTTALLVLLVVLVLALGYGAVRGGGPWLFLLALGLVGGAFMAVQTARFALAAGPGWLSVRGLTRRRWVRTDQLVSLKDGPVGVDRVLTLRDRDGRRLGVQLSELRGAEQAHAQVLRDLRTSIGAGLAVSDVTRRRLGL